MGGDPYEADAVGAGGAGGAGAAGVGDPLGGVVRLGPLLGFWGEEEGRRAAGGGGTHLDAHAVADLDAAGPGGGTELMHDADAFVAADLAGLGGVGEALPGVCHDA